MTFDELKKQYDAFSATSMAICGQKEVYAAIHPIYGKVVVKRLRETNARALRELEITSSHVFDRTPRLFESHMLDENGQECLVMVEEFIEGESLLEIIRRGAKYDASATVDFLEQAFSFVKQISSEGIVHRDIKPGNIIRNEEGSYIFLDFGIARILDAESLTKTEGHGPNTPGYAAPEQFMNHKDEIDSRADLFSVGVVAYELATGSNPFRDKFSSDFQVYLNTMTITPAQLAIKGDSQLQLAGLISSLMSRLISERPQNADQALNLLNYVKRTIK